MAHKVKCIYCEKTFDRDNTPNIKIGRRYAHVDCYENNHTPDDDYKGKLFALLKELFGSDYNYVIVEKQRKSYIANGYSNKDIYQALYYHYYIKNGSVANAKGRIGIVPYVIDEAKAYYEKIENKIDHLESAAKNYKDNEIFVKMKEINLADVKDSRRIDLSELE